MGMFKQLKDAKKMVEAAPEMVQQSMQMAEQAQQMAAAQHAAAQQQALAAQQAAVGAGSAAGADLEPIAGVSLETFAAVCRELASHGYDQSKAAGIAAEKGIDGANWQQALDGWNARVKANPAVAQQFNTHYRAG